MFGERAQPSSARVPARRWALPLHRQRTQKTYSCTSSDCVQECFNPSLQVLRCSDAWVNPRLRRAGGDHKPLRLGYPNYSYHRTPRVLSADEVARLIEADGNLQARAILMTLYSTGSDRANWFGLRVEDIDSERMVYRDSVLRASHHSSYRTPAGSNRCSHICCHSCCLSFSATLRSRRRLLTTAFSFIPTSELERDFVQTICSDAHMRYPKGVGPASVNRWRPSAGRPDSGPCPGGLRAHR